MISLVHIINPVDTDQSSDLFIAQPITFETMRIAREFARGQVDVSLYAIQVDHEKPVPLPDCFKRLPGITRTVSDIFTFQEKRELPLIKDILDAAYRTIPANSPGRSYIIYTNVDIALQPYFYTTVAGLIERGHDAFIINRRTIPDSYENITQINEMYSETGETHPGWDCFIFDSGLYENFETGTACIGSGWIGRVMIINMTSLAKKFKLFPNFHMTFHIGNERRWKSDRYNDYLEHNKNQCKEILIKFETLYGPFDREKLPGRFFNRFDENTITQD